MAESKKTVPSEDPLIPIFKSLGLTQTKAAEAVKSPKSAAILKDLIETNALADRKLDEKQATSISTLAIQLSKTALGPGESTYIVNKLISGQLKSNDQISGAYAFSLQYLLPLIFPPIQSGH